MKRLMLLKNLSDEEFDTSSPCFIASRMSTLYELIQKSPYTSTKLSDTYVKANTTKFLGFATEIIEM
jgi:hypothetical protein